jgi:ABC-2 type transport system ATP-binding protein
MGCVNTSIRDSEPVKMVATKGQLDSNGNPGFESNDAAISIQNVSKTYPAAFARVRAMIGRPPRPPVEALRDVSFDIKKGEIFGLIGRNGAGKTTLTKIVATLVQPTRGRVSVLGHDSVREDQKVRRQIGLTNAEERSFYWRLTSTQNLLFFARLHGLSDSVAKRRISELFDKLELNEVAKRRFGELSTGNKQRLAVARALLPQPPVLLLDEPTRSLDPLAAETMRELISSLAKQDPPVSILFTSHNLSEVESLCARVAIISRGMIRAIDSPDKLRGLTSGSERVTITVAGIVENQTHGLRDIITDFSLTQSDTQVRISFDRRSDDLLLNEVIIHLFKQGGRILDVTTERSTLLDVLESFETETVN